MTLLGKKDELILIEDIAPWYFRGIDSHGLEIIFAFYTRRPDRKVNI